MERLSPVWAHRIKQEAKALEADEDQVHNNLMHKSILATWERGSPVMWARLQAANLVDPLARVLQARMWARKAELMQGGLPVTDAREEAERETLMLEPEADQESDRLEALQRQEPTTYLPDLSTLPDQKNQ